MSEHDAAGDRESVAGMTGPDGPLLRLIKDRRVAFLVVGGINTGIGLVWFVLFTLLFHVWWPEDPNWTVFAVIVSAQSASVLSAFFLYRRFVFRVTGHLWLDLARFVLFYLGTFILNIVAVPPLTIFLGWDKIVAQLVFTVVYAIASWFYHSRFSFRRKAEKAP